MILASSTMSVYPVKHQANDVEANESGVMAKVLRRLLLLVIVIVVCSYIGIGWLVASLTIEYRDVIDRDDPEWRAIYAPEWDVPVTETVEILNNERVLVADVYDNPADGDCGVIIVHGMGGDRNLVRQFAPLFYQMGCDVIGYDFAPRNNDVLLTYGYDEKDDLAAVVEWFAESSELPYSQIGILGTSFGAATTLQYLPQNSEIAWAIADSSYRSLAGLLNDQVDSIAPPMRAVLPMTHFVIEQRTGITMEAVSPVDAIAETDVPVLLIHSLSDELIPYSDSEAIFENARAETTRLELTDWDAAHVESYYDDKVTYSNLVLDFLAQFAPDFGNQAAVNPPSL